MILRFGPFSIDAARRLLLRGGVSIHVTPKAFDLLSLLVSEAPRVLSKRELHERLWPGTFVSDASLTGLIKELRRALRDDESGDVLVIRTAHRVGYACDLAVQAAARDRLPWHWLIFDSRRIQLQHAETVIGRDPEADVWLDLPGVSRRHARIVIDPAGVRLEDLGSKNGTMVGDSPVQSSINLHDGDRIVFGSVTSVYRTTGTGASTETRVSSEMAREPTISES